MNTSFTITCTGFESSSASRTNPDADDDDLSFTFDYTTMSAASDPEDDSLLYLGREMGTGGGVEVPGVLLPVGDAVRVRATVCNPYEACVTVWVDGEPQVVLGTVGTHVVR